MSLHTYFKTKTGQKLDETAEKALKELPEDAPWTQKLLVKHRRLVGKLASIVGRSLSWLSVIVDMG